MLACALLVLSAAVSAQAAVYLGTQQTYNLCAGDTLTLDLSQRQLKLYTDTIVRDTVAVAGSSDSLYNLHVVHVLPKYLFTEPSRTLREDGQSFDWRELTITEEGTYQQVYKSNVNGCDSIYRITVYRTRTEQEERTICQGDSTFWRGHYYSLQGRYEDLLRSKDDLRDSIIYRLVLHTTYIPDTTFSSRTICRGSWLDWRGRRLTEPGLYTDTLVSSKGCDSVVHLSLNVVDVDTIVQIYRLTEGETYTWLGKEYTTAGVYDTLLRNSDPSGCDTVARLYLSTLPIDTIDTTVVICRGQEFEWHGITANRSGVYYRAEKPTDYSQTIYRLNLTIRNIPETDVRKYICHGGSLEFLGKTYTAAGVYFDTVMTTNGCDSALRITITEMYPEISTTVARIADGQTYIWNGKPYTKAGTYDSIMPRPFGCDSIARLELSTYHVDTIDTVAYICYGETLTWQGMTGSTTHVYEKDGTRPNGDKVHYRLDLRVTRIPITYLTDTLCQDGTGSRSIHFGDTILKTSGIYTQKFLGQHGCDSVVVLRLQVTRPDSIIEERRIPEGTFTTWNGKNYSESGYYDSISQNRFGCDSLNRLILTVYHVDTIDTTVYVCAGQSYTWHGITGSETRVYEFPGTRDNGDRVYYRMDMRMMNIPVTYIKDTLCQTAGNSSITFVDTTLTTSGTYSHTFRSQHGCDSVVVLELTVVHPDSTIISNRIPEGTFTTWNGKEYSQSGVYDTIIPNRFGCDSLSRLILTVYPIDTIDTIATICPNTSLEWHGMVCSETKHYEFPGYKDNGDQAYYRLDLTVKELVEIEKHFSLCDEDVVTFNGKTYNTAGTTYDRFSCDTIYKIVITKNPTSYHFQTGVMDATHPYYWSYTLDGEQKTDTITAPGHYEHTTVDPTTGCSDTWHLELTRDETKYHFVEEQTICEDEEFDWRGRTGLNHQFVGKTTHYFDNYRTVADQDSIYELILTVKPVLRSSQTIKFCGSLDLNGTTHTESKVLIDTFTSIQYHCDSIVTTILVQGSPFHLHDTLTLVPGETATWRGQTIDHDGWYDERHTNSFGCDSIYSLGVGYKAATPVTNTHTDKVTICEGNYHDWRGDHYFNTGTYHDTVYVNNDPTQGVDSIYILHLTVNPIYHSTERITFTSFPGTYREHVFWAHGEHYDFHYQSSTGCDSIITVYADLQVIVVEENASVCRSELPYRWRDHEYNEAYRYVETVKDAAGNDSVQYILNLSVKDAVETRITKTICQGSSYTFGNQTLTETGVYRYTFKDFGCDSTVVLSLNVLSIDTNVFVHHIDEGEYYDWNGERYNSEGIYFSTAQNRFGCDSINVLQLIVNRVDTVDTTVVICPNEIPFFWHGIRATQSGDYYTSERQDNGDYNYFRLHLTVRELQYIDTTFTICDDEQIIFNGKTYTESGVFTDYLSCDTVLRVRINKHPQQVYVTTASLGGEHGYTWTFMKDGTETTETFNEPGTYEYESPNPVTGCSEIWRLVLNRDETEYHFVETLTLCEGEPFSWHGMNNLTQQGIGSTSNYLVKYQTRAGKDSIYELILTVNPIERTTQVIPFCDAYVLNGKTYTATTTVVDTAHTGLGCYSIVTYILQKNNSFHRHDTTTIIPGQTLYWRGQTITNTGLYTDEHTTASGCDSIYTLGVGMKEDAPHMKMQSWTEEICEGDTLFWRNKNYYNTGIYVDTVFVGSTNEVDSLYVLNLTVHPTYLFRERITFTNFPGTYRGHDFTYHGETDTIRYTSAGGCDSIYIVVAEREVRRTEETVVLCADEIATTPYVWKWNGATYTESGRYVVVVKDAQGNDSVEHILNLTVKNIPVTYIDRTICQGGSYTFGDRTLTQAGEYDFTFTSGSCDSIVHLSLNVVHADTNILVHHMNPGDNFTWNNKIYDSTGTYFYYGINRFGCDSVAVLELTVNKVDTIDTTAVICPNEIPLRWHGIAASQTGDYSNGEQQSNGQYNFYRLHLTVRELHYKDTTFTICDDEQVHFNGKSYSDAGEFTDYLSCDTIMRIHINKHPQRIYETRAALGQDQYSWTYGPAGQEQSVTYDTPGTYEFEFPNAETGCSEIWRLILSQDMNEYHFEERLTICEGDNFNWHGMSNLSHQYIGQEHEYKAEYKTRNGKDSIYTLYLTVTPIKRTYKTIVFCDEIDWKGVRYTQSAVVTDTLISSTGCDSIVRVNLDKATPFHSYEYRDLPQGEVLHWHGFDIFTDGVYRDAKTTAAGCDSIYELKVTIVPATPHTNQYATELSTCEGDTIVWRGKNIWTGGTYVDTVWSAGREKVDSIFTLRFTVWPAPKDTNFVHLYTCGQGASIYYQGTEYTDNDTIISNLHTIHGCDSIVKVYLHFNTALYLSDTVEINDTQLPYTWHYRLSGSVRDTVLTTAGTYLHTEPAEGSCENKEELVLIVYPTYLFELDTTICETALPFYWTSGPQDHANDALQHTIGTTKQYEYRYSTVNNTDSIYRLNLTIDPAPHTTEYYYVCSGTPQDIRGKTYGNGIDETDRVYRDTVTASDPNGQCDSIIYIEVYVSSLKKYTETRILHQDETIDWNNYHITQGGDYRDTVKTGNGCDSISVLHVVQETRKHERICETDLPYTWDKNGQDYSSTGIWEYTETDGTTGNIIGYYTLYLTVDTVPTRIEQRYVCAGYPEEIYGTVYGALNASQDTVYRDTVPGLSSVSCDTTIYVEIYVSSVKKHTQTVLLHYGETIDWNGLTITRGGDYSDTTEVALGCDSISILHVIEERRQNTTVCEWDLPYHWDQNGQDYNTAGIKTDTVLDSYGNIAEFYSLYLQIDTVPTRVEQHFVCHGYAESIRGHWYGRPTDPTDTIYRFNDTILAKGSMCDSVIFVEIHVNSLTERVQTIILQDGDSYDWNGKVITEGGVYRDTTQVAEGCDSISILQVIKELRIDKTICRIDTTEDTPADKRYPYVWVHQRPGVPNDTLYTSGIYTDTTYSDDNYITEFYSLHLTITHPYDTTIYVHGCQEHPESGQDHKKGAWWYGQPNEIFWNDTSFIYRKEVNPADPNAPCDSIFYVHVVMDTTYVIHVDDTICEEHLPYVLGRTNPELIWAEGTYYHPDETACGCDSSIYLTLRIIPKLTKNDSTFICEEVIKEHPVVLGDTVTPWFDVRNGGQYSGEWEGKWHGVSYTTDTIVWNCDSSYYHHIIMRPKQDVPAKDTFYLCQGDSVQLFWPYKDYWVHEEGVYTETVQTYSPFVDETHGTTHYDKNFLCDSTIEWTVFMLDTIHEYDTIHIPMGDSLLFDNEWRFITGVYDSISYGGPDPLPASGTAIQGANGLELPLKDSRDQYCKYVKTLYLFVDSTYYYRDTLEICEMPGKGIEYTWKDGYKRPDPIILPMQDTTFHVIDTLLTYYYRFDSIYDLYIDYHQMYFTQILDTICEGDSLRFDIHNRDNTITQRFVSVDGVYYDTIPALNGCDSIIELYLKTRDSIPTTYEQQMITDREIPYLWTHQWYENGVPKDSTDTLRATGIYTFTMPSQYGCDSTIVLNFTVHQTHVFRDTIDICSVTDKTFTHIWSTGREQSFTVPDRDSAIHYYDTLQTRIKYDSIYDLLVNYKEQTITYLDTSLCYGDSILFGLTRAHEPRFLSKSGNYQDTLVRTVNGCDSIIVLRLNVFPRYFNDYTHHISSADTPYIWVHEQGGVEIARDSLYAEGNYIYTYNNAYGCDSIDSLHLFIHQAYLYRDTIQICASETPYTWGSKTDIYHTGEYIQYFRTHDDQADSTHVRYIKVMPVEHDSITMTICEGDSVRFGLTNDHQPRWLYHNGIYNDTLTTQHGCDSIITLSLNVFPRHYNDTTIHIADVDTPYVWIHMQGGVEKARDSISAEGRYGYTFHSEYGCDSIDSIRLVVHPTYLFKDTITICTSETPYTWYNVDENGDSTLFQKAIYETGQYIKNLQTHDGYDSTYMRFINVLPVKRTEIHDSICEGENNFYIFKGQHLQESGVYTDTMTASNGCDSIVILNLTVNKAYYSFREEHIVEGQTLHAYGQTFTTDTVYTQKGVTPNGCDSTTVLKVVVHPLIDTTVYVCSYDLPYQWINKWNGQVTQLYADGLYRNDTTYVNGQQMFYGLRLIVNDPVVVTIHDSICEGESNFYTFKGQHLTQSGVYRDTTVAANGCDSITILNLTVNKPYYNYIERHIIEGQSVTVLGHTFDTDTVFTIKGNTPNGCDSITDIKVIKHPMVDTTVIVCSYELPYQWTNKWNGQVTPLYAAGLYRNDTTVVDGKQMFYGLRLIVNEPVFKTIRDSICEGENNYYIFKGQHLTESGIYRDTTAAANGCDSITTLYLTVNKPYYNYIERHIIEGQSVTVLGHTFDTDTVFSIKSNTPNGCDSITDIKVIKHPMVDTTVTVCSYELPYQWTNKWNGQVTPLYAAGLYRNDTTYVDGKQMFYGLRLIVNEPVVVTIHDSICEGNNNFYTFKGLHLNETGVYNDTTVGANGCDSITILYLTVNKPYYSYREEHIVEGQSVTFDNHIFSTDTVYTKKGLTPNGCDSTTVLKVIVHPLVDTTVVVCSDDLPYQWINKWNGQITPLYSAGIYRNDTTVVNGVQMFYGLRLIVNNPVFDTTRVSICEGSYYLYKGRNLTEQGIYRDTLAAQNGCDSIHTLILTVNQPYFHTIHQDVLVGQEVAFFDTVYNTTGTYYHYGTTPFGCDSTTVLELVVHQLVDTIVTVCENDLPYHWTNRWSGEEELFYSAGTYRNDTTIDGQKFFFGIDFRTVKQIFDTVQVSICSGGSYLFGGKPITEAGIYRDTLTAPNGCDSIQTLILTVNEPYYSTRTEHIIEGNEFVFFGDTFNTTGVYTHYGKNEYGCDSTSILQLFVHPLVDTVVTVCSSELPYQWINKWTGSVIELYTEGLYRNDTTYFNGERMFNGLQLIVRQPSDTTIYRDICEGDTYNFNGLYLKDAGEYRDTIKNSIGCDSIVILHLNVLSKYLNIIERTIHDGDTVHFQNQVYSTAGIYPARFTSSYGCDSIVELHLNVIRLFDDSVSVCANALPYIWTLPSDSTKFMTIYESGIYRDTVVNTEGQLTAIGLKVTVLPIAHAPEAVVATICEGEFYKFGDTVLTEQGTYYDTLVAANGCDSIVMLALQVMPVQYQSETRRIFEGDSVFFYGEWLKTSGVYEHRETNGNQCTNTHQLILTVLKSFNVDTTAVICDNELPFIWRGYEYNATGDYSLPIAWTDSSRVVKTLHLTVNETFYGERNVSLCFGNLFIYKRDTFKTDTIFYDTIPSLVGCDSVLKYVVSVHPTFERWDTVHISDKQSYTYCDGRVLTLQGDYECSGITKSGCDSISHLHLVVHPSYEFKEEESVCQSDPNNYPFQWHGRTFTESGIYYDSLLTHKYGFDSIYVLNLVVHPSYFIYEQYLIKEGETTTLHGINITRTDTIYTDTLHTFYGCDSIYQIAVNTKRMMEVDRVVEICDGDFYDLYGKKLTKAGNYTGMNEDTIVHLTLIVNEHSLFKQRIVITEEDIPYIYKGHFYEPEAPVWDKTTQSWDQDVKTTIFSDSLINRFGCDSVIRIEFVVTTHYSEWNQIPLCSGSQLIIDTDTIKKAGFYTFVRRSKETGKLDSLYRIEVYESPSYEMPVVKRAICSGDTVMFGGKIFDRNGVHRITLKSVDGCDSIITLDLTVNPAYYMEKTVSLWPEELPYHWEGRDYYNAGDYPVSWQIGDCDSTRMLHLIVLQPDTQRTVLCEGQTITWFGTTYNASGIYSHTTYDQYNNVTAINVLILTIAHPTQIVSANVGTIVEGDDRFDINFTYSGYSPTSYNLIFDARAKQAGFTDVYGATIMHDGIATVRIPQFADTCWNGHARYVRPDNYTVKLVLDNGPCGESRTEDLQFQIKYPSWIIEQNWDDVVAPLKPECNCGYNFSQTQWFVNNQIQANTGEGYLHSDALNVGDEVVMNAKRKGESYFIPTYPLKIKVYDWQMYDTPILKISPKHAPHYNPYITIDAEVEGVYEIYSSAGNFVSRGSFEQGKTTVTLPTISGLYIIRTHVDNETMTHKVILY